MIDVSYKYRLFRRKLAMLNHPLWVNHPENIMLDLTNRCVNECCYCNVAEGHSFGLPRGDMPYWMASEVLNHYKKKLFWSIALFANGESMLVPEMLTELCSLSHEICNTMNLIDTSGAVFRNRKALIHPNLKLVRFTISAATRETYKKVHGRDNFDEALSTFKWYNDHKLPHQNSWLHFIACKYNEHELEQWIKKFEGYGRTIYPMHRGTGYQLDSEKALGEVVDKPFHIYPNGKRALVHSLMNKYKPCPCYDILAVSNQGEILECIDFPTKFNYGKVGEVNLDAVWQERLRNKMDNECCNNCNLRFPNYKQILNKWVR